MTTAHPTGTVTSLFTDIEGSIKLAQEYPVKWESLPGQTEDAAYQKSWNEDRAMTLEQAIDLALDSK